VITKKWVNRRLKEHEEQLGYREIFHIIAENEWASPEISVIKKINAICKYLGIEIVKEAKAEAIVARKIKKAK